MNFQTSRKLLAARMNLIKGQFLAYGWAYSAHLLRFLAANDLRLEAGRPTKRRPASLPI